MHATSNISPGEKICPQVLFAKLCIFLISTMSKKSAPKLSNDIILYFDIENGITETQVQPSLLEPFPFMQPTLRNIIDALYKAKTDKRVKGLVFSVNGAPINIAHIEELREAITDFKQSGKFTKIYGSNFTDTMGGLSQYYLASSFDEIWMQPVGMLGISGPSMIMPFAKDALDKLGVSAQFYQREEFKSAMENFTNTDISPENTESLTALLNDLSLNMMQEVSKQRGFSMPVLKGHIDKGLLTGEEALAAKLIDRLDYGDVLLSELRQEISGDPDDEFVELVSIGRYISAAPKKVKVAKDNNNVALIYVSGTIVDQAGAGGSAGADEIVSTLYAAYNDEDIDAIVLRVDSPGGSPTASETIRRALIKAKEKGKKVIISMGPVAASGGYWISTDADLIFANAGTITGSIGVVMGKFEGGVLFERMGVNWQGPQFGENADIFGIHNKFDTQADARMNVLIDSTYNAFLTRVSEGRGLTIGQARSVAKGRPWTGLQAKKLKLVDEIGSLNTALDKTAILLNHINRHDLNVVKMPRELNSVERLLEIFGQEVSLGYFVNTLLGTDSRISKTMNGYITQSQLSKNGSHMNVYNPDLEAMR